MMSSMMFWLVACAVSVVIPRLAFSTNKSVSFARFIRIKLNKSHRECCFVSTFITYSLNFLMPNNISEGNKTDLKKRKSMFLFRF